MIKLNINVILDSRDRKRSRICFWEFVRKDFDDQGYKFQFISVQDALNSDNPFKLLELFDIRKTDIIILNWDSINNDPIYGSDKAYQFFNHYKSELNDWVRDGGIIILEAQTAAWKLVQNSYDIFAKEFPIKITERREHRKTAIINKKLKKKHPILKELSDTIDLEQGELSKKRWFPWDRNICNIDRSPQRRLSLGWFDNYSREWEPLIFVETNRKKPIMLCRIMTKENPAGPKSRAYPKIGAYIITTMYIGASGLHQLIKNILNFPENIQEYYIEKEAEIKKKKRIFEVSSTIIILIIFLKFYHNITNILNISQKQIVSVLFWAILMILITAIGTLIAMFAYEPIRSLKKKLGK